MLRTMGQNPTDSQVNDMINEVDVEGSGLIEFSEFVKFVIKLHSNEGDQDEEAREIFRRLVAIRVTLRVTVRVTVKVRVTVRVTVRVALRVIVHQALYVKVSHSLFSCSYLDLMLRAVARLT